MRSPQVPLVALLRGVNVGGHRTFRPAVLAAELSHLDVVNIGAAGTFVVRRRVGKAEVRVELARVLPFETEIAICEGREIAGLLSRYTFADSPERSDIVPFVSVLASSPRLTPSLPLSLPAEGEWLLRLLAREGRFVVGEYRRHMKVVSYLGKVDSFFGVPATTRNWRTLTSIGKVLERGATT